MLVYLVLFFAPGIVLCWIAGLVWRRVVRSRPHWLIALVLALVVWVGGWLLGILLYLIIADGGVVGDVATLGMTASIVSAITGFQVFRRYGHESMESVP